MSVAQGASSYIHEGLWHDWSQSSVLGSTLTVNPYHASILSPAIAIFVAIAGSQLWRLFQFGLHQARASGRSDHFLYHQQQVVLRNTGADLNTIWRLLRLGIAWRHQKNIPVLRTSIPLLIWSLLHFVIVIVASVLSSWILSAGDMALSRSPFCGTFNQSYLEQVYSSNVSDPTVPALAMEYAAYINERFAAVQQHIDICSTSVAGCDIGTGQDITYAAKIMPGNCPFNGDVCHPDIDGTISFDTGFLSSMDHLGINAPARDRISFRFTAQCAPLNDAKYTTGWQSVPSTDGFATNSIADALYGTGATSSRNATYSISKLDVSCDQRATMQPYAIDAQYAAAGGSIDQSSATFEPIQELQSADADLSVMLLSFNNAYNGPVIDPWFAASAPYNDSNAFCLQQDKVFYVRDRPLTGLGCKQQWQICNTTKDNDLDNRHCTPAMGIYQQDDLLFGGAASSDIEFNSAQLALLSRFDQTVVRASYYYVNYALSKATSPPLKARNLISTSAGLPLPATQWQVETKYWTDILLAYVQQSWLDFSTGQFSPSTAYINVTTGKHEKNLDLTDRAASEICANQIVRTTDYRNFNFFALMMTLVLGTIIIVLGLTIEDIIGCIRQRKLNYTGSNGKQDMWIQNSDIEMLKTISELKSGAVWSKSRNGIPLAGAGAKASINDLRADDYDVDSEKGLITPAVKRHQTSLSQTSTRYGSHGNGQEDAKTCVTCDSVEVDHASLGGSLPTAAPIAFVYHNDFSKNIEQPPVPKIDRRFQSRFLALNRSERKAQPKASVADGYLIQ